MSLDERAKEIEELAAEAERIGAIKIMTPTISLRYALDTIKGHETLLGMQKEVLQRQEDTLKRLTDHCKLYDELEREYNYAKAQATEWNDEAVNRGDTIKRLTEEKERYSQQCLYLESEIKRLAKENARLTSIIRKGDRLIMEKPETKTVYISGPMSGYEDLNFPAFYAAEERLRGMGYSVVNPAAIDQPVKKWEACMKLDIRELMLCDAVVTLPGWGVSRGARIEVELAAKLGMDVIEFETIVAAINALNG